MEKVLDGLAVLFPFELDSYKDVDLPVTFVGHPFAKASYQAPVSYDESGPVVLLPGSRVQPVERILPCFLDAFELLSKKFPGLDGLIPVPDAKIEQVVRALIEARPDLQDKGFRRFPNQEVLSAYRNPGIAWTSFHALRCKPRCRLAFVEASAIIQGSRFRRALRKASAAFRWLSNCRTC